MTVFRGNSEPDPMPASAAALAASAQLAKPEVPKATFTGQDAGLPQSLADLRKGYSDAAKIQSDSDRQAAIHRAAANAQIDAATPGARVNFVDHRDEQYQAGDSSLIPSTDPAWTEPTEKLREQLLLTQELYGANGQLNKLLATGSEKDAQRAVELEDRLRKSIGESGASLPPIEQPQQPQARPETFPDGEVVHVTQNSDGTLSAEYITGERFTGDPLTITQQIAKSHIQTKRWAQQQRAQAQQQPQQPQQQQLQNDAPTGGIYPASGVLYDAYGAPQVDVGATVLPDETYATLSNLATALGYSGANELVADQMDLRAKTNQLSQELAAEREDRQNKEVAAVFLGANPDFPNSQESIDAIGDLITQNNLEWTPENMAMAHSYAVKNGLYQPLSQEEIEAAVGLTVQARRPTPPPMIRGGNPESSWQATDPHTMPLEELRKLAIKQELEGKTPSYR